MDPWLTLRLLGYTVAHMPSEEIEAFVRRGLENMTKVPLAELAHLVATGRSALTSLDGKICSTGGTVRMELLQGIASEIGSITTGTKQQIARGIADSLGMDWEANYTSQGGTVTAPFFRDVILSYLR